MMPVIPCISFLLNLRFLMIKPTKWLCAQRRQISLGIRPVWSESSLSGWRKLGSLDTHWAHSKDCSDWADAQADLSLRWAHSHFDPFGSNTIILFSLAERRAKVSTRRDCLDISTGRCSLLLLWFQNIFTISTGNVRLDMKSFWTSQYVVISVSPR